LSGYTFLIGLAALVSVAWAWFNTRDARIFSVALITAVFALAFGRAGYVLLNWDYFSEHTIEIVSLTGLLEHGALVGGALGAACAMRLYPNALRPSHIASAAIVIGIAASIGCIPSGCAYGREVFWQDGANSPGWLLRVDWPDAYGVNNPRWPTQALLAGWLFAGTAILVVVTRWQGGKVTDGASNRSVTLSPLHPSSFDYRSGGSGQALVILFALGDFFIQFLRADPAITLGGLRIYQWFDLALGMLAAFGFAFQAVQARR
jgi:prolipoprotein diacylglyceryltransferase